MLRMLTTILISLVWAAIVTYFAPLKGYIHWLITGFVIALVVNFIVWPIISSLFNLLDLNTPKQIITISVLSGTVGHMLLISLFYWIVYDSTVSTAINITGKTPDNVGFNSNGLGYIILFGAILWFIHGLLLYFLNNTISNNKINKDNLLDGQNPSIK